MHDIGNTLPSPGSPLRGAPGMGAFQTHAER